MSSRRARPIAEINITPFTDVILVLLIIFMITTPLLVQSGIKVNLPRAGRAEAMNNAGQADIIVTEDSRIFLNGEPVTKKTLKDKIGVMQKNNPDLRVVLFSDRLARFKDIVAVLDAMKELGIRNLNIAAHKGADGR